MLFLLNIIVIYLFIIIIIVLMVQLYYKKTGNINVDDIKENISQINSEINSIETNASITDDNVKTNKQNISEINSKITTLDDNVKTNKQNISEINSKITTLDDNVKTNKQNISEINSKIQTNANRIDNIKMSNIFKNLLINDYSERNDNKIFNTFDEILQSLSNIYKIEESDYSNTYIENVNVTNNFVTNEININKEVFTIKLFDSIKNFNRKDTKILIILKIINTFYCVIDICIINIKNMYTTVLDITIDDNKKNLFFRVHYRHLKYDILRMSNYYIINLDNEIDTEFYKKCKQILDIQLKDYPIEDIFLYSFYKYKTEFEKKKFINYFVPENYLSNFYTSEDKIRGFKDFLSIYFGTLKLDNYQYISIDDKAEKYRFKVYDIKLTFIM